MAVQLAVCKRVQASAFPDSQPLLLCCQAQVFSVDFPKFCVRILLYLCSDCVVFVSTKNCVVLKMLSHLWLQTEGRDCWCMQRRPVWTAHLELDPHIDEEMVTMTMMIIIVIICVEALS